MALVVICGQPCSGKSTVAACLAEALQETEPKPSVRIIDESSFQMKNGGINQRRLMMIKYLKIWLEGLRGRIAEAVGIHRCLSYVPPEMGLKNRRLP